jgi:hypothetical protein
MWNQTPYLEMNHIDLLNLNDFDYYVMLTVSLPGTQRGWLQYRIRLPT